MYSWRIGLRLELIDPARDGEAGPGDRAGGAAGASPRTG